MRFVLTGHKGLIGSFLLDKLIKRGDTPVLLVDKREGNDIKDMVDHELDEPADLCIHLASFCKIDKTIEDPRLAFENNVAGMFAVMEFCRKNNIPKIVFTSSSRVLSKEKNPYTASKMYGEELVKGYCDSYGIQYVIIRPSTVYGPFNDLTKRLMDVFIVNALKGDELKIFGDTKKNLDFTYIDDFIDGFLIAMKETNKEFNISTGRQTRVEHVADLVINLAGKGTKKFYPPQIAQPQEIDIDISALQALGYAPKVSIEEGVTKTFKWYSTNEEFLQQRLLTLVKN